MAPPFVSYVTFHRLGLTVRNLPVLLGSPEDFELHLIDCNSRDDTWEYLSHLDDSRIRSRMHLELNHGTLYAINMNLKERAPDQYFFHMDNDVHLETPDWIARFMKIFAAFPEVGLLGVSPIGTLPPITPQARGDASYLELAGNAADPDNNYVPCRCFAMRPELIAQIGYFCEENYVGARELTHRILTGTGFQVGFVPDVVITAPDSVPCAECPYAGLCTLNKTTDTCFEQFNKKNVTDRFFRETRWKWEETMRDMASGARPVYCASLLDQDSMQQHLYNMDWALENFLYYIRNAN